MYGDRQTDGHTQNFYISVDISQFRFKIHFCNKYNAQNSILTRESS